LNEPIHVAMEVGVGAYREAISICQVVQRSRKVFLGQHRCALNQQWNDRDITLKGRLNLDAHKIARIIEM
jgi:hypothetical protein